MMNPMLAGFALAMIPFVAAILAVASIALYHWAFPAHDALDESNE